MRLSVCPSLRFLFCGAAGLVMACGSDTVEPAGPDSIAVSPGTVALRVGQTQQLIALVFDETGAQITGVGVTFSSSDPLVASVTPGGLVTASAAGSATITATASPSVTATIPTRIRRLPSLEVVASPAVSGCPYGIALAATGTGYVAQTCATTVTRFNVAGPTLTGTATVGSSPPHVAMSPDGATAYAVLQAGGALVVVDVPSNTAVDTIGLGPREGYNVLASPDGERVYVTTGSGTVFAMDAATHALVDSVNVNPNANGLALHPTQPILYVSSIFAATVAAINTTTFTVTRTYNVGGRLQRIAVSPDGSELYAANISGLSIVDLGSGAVTPVELGGESIGLALDAAGDYVYVSLWALGKVAVVDLYDRAVFGDIMTGGDPRNIAIGADGTVVIANQDGWFDVVR